MQLDVLLGGEIKKTRIPEGQALAGRWNVTWALPSGTLLTNQIVETEQQAQAIVFALQNTLARFDELKLDECGALSPEQRGKHRRRYW